MTPRGYQRRSERHGVRVDPPGGAGVATVGVLRQALAEYPDDTPVELALAGVDTAILLITSYWFRRPGSDASSLRASLVADQSGLPSGSAETRGYLRGLQAALTGLTNWSQVQYPSLASADDPPLDQHTVQLALSYLRAVHQSANERVRAQQEEGK